MTLKGKNANLSYINSNSEQHICGQLSFILYFIWTLNSILRIIWKLNAAQISYSGLNFCLQPIRYFQWLFNQTNNMVDDDIRSLFIDALHETLRYDEKKQATAGLMPVSICAL